MNRFKVILSLILCTAMIFSCCVFSTGADSTELYPESEHNYSNDFYGEWSYTHPQQVEGLYVTFSDDTFTEDGESYTIIFEDLSTVDINELIEYNRYHKTGDYIAVFDGNNNLIGSFQGDELAGRTLYIPGSAFKVSLTSDSVITGYGFKVTNISTQPESDGFLMYLHLPDDSVETVYFDSKISQTDAIPYLFYNCFGIIIDGEAIIGWRLSEDGDILYYDGANATTTFINPNQPGTYHLYAVTTPVALLPEDVYSFQNGSDEFTAEAGNRYYLSKEDYIRLVSSACIVNGLSPLALPAAVTSVVLATYPNWEYGGSCIGFTSTVCQQKKGIIDVVSTQEGAECMSDLELTQDLVSLLNYYNGQSFTSALVKNKALKSEPEEYSRQLKKMFESAEQGNLVLLEFFTSDTLTGGYHGVAVSGAYTDDNGNHVLLCYDSNFPAYSHGYCRICVISPDFTSLDTVYYDEGLAFVWTDDFECYRSLDIDTVRSPHHYHFELIKHIFEVLTDWFSAYFFNVFKG